MKRTLLALGVGALLATPCWAAKVSIDFDADAVDDGVIHGTIKGYAVTVSATDGPANGGILVSEAWALADCTNDVPGIGDPGVVDEAATVDWIPGAQGGITISFATSVTDPIVLVSYTDNVVETFNFVDGYPVTLLDSYPPGDVNLVGQQVSTTGAAGNTAIDGFAVLLTGTMSVINIQTNLNLDTSTQSVAISVVAEEDDVPVELQDFRIE